MDGKGSSSESKARGEVLLADKKVVLRGREGHAATCDEVPKWGAGLSEQLCNRLNHGRVRVRGVMRRYTHLQHVKVRCFRPG